MGCAEYFLIKFWVGGGQGLSMSAPSLPRGWAVFREYFERIHEFGSWSLSCWGCFAVEEPWAFVLVLAGTVLPLAGFWEEVWWSLLRFRSCYLEGLFCRWYEAAFTRLRSKSPSSSKRVVEWYPRWRFDVIVGGTPVCIARRWAACGLTSVQWHVWQSQCNGCWFAGLTAVLFTVLLHEGCDPKMGSCCQHERRDYTWNIFLCQ